MKNEIFDKTLDALLDEAIPEYAMEQKYDEDKEVVFSEKHNQKMKEMFDNLKRKERMHRIYSVTKKVAVIVITVCLTLALTSPQLLAWRSKIFDILVQNHGDYSWIIFKEVEDEVGERGTLSKQLSEKEKSEILSCFGYLPDGFELNFASKDKFDRNIKFLNLDSNSNILFNISNKNINRCNRYRRFRK